MTNNRYFKYKSLSGESRKYLYKLLKTGKIFASEFKNLNDPMEGIFIGKEIDCQNILDKKGKQRIVSLTDSPYNTLMWSHYADSHKGVCLEISFEDETNIVDVKYRDEVIDVDNSRNDKHISILKNKLSPWLYERESRYISEEEYVDITINKIYLGLRFEDSEDKESFKEDVINIYNAYQPDKKIPEFEQVDVDKLLDDIKKNKL